MGHTKISSNSFATAMDSSGEPLYQTIATSGNSRALSMRGFHRKIQPGFERLFAAKIHKPYRENLRALIDALETLFRFGNGFDRRDPVISGVFRIECDANILPLIRQLQL